MAEDGCINSGIFQNLDILGKVEFKNAKFTGDVNVGTQTSDILTINSRIKMPNVDDEWGLDVLPYPISTDNKKVLVRQTDNTLRFEPKAERVFQTIIVDNQDNIRASNLADTLTLKPGTNMTIETEGNAITFSSSSGSNVQNIYKTIRVDGHNDLIPNTSIDVLKFQGTSNIDITPTKITNATTTYRAVINYDNDLYADNNNENKTITLYDYQTAVVFTMVTGEPATPTATAVEFKKETDVDTTATNLSTAINNHNAFSSNIDTANNKIIVTQISSDGTPTANTETFVSSINGPGDFDQVTQEISTLTVGLKDNKITDDLIIGEDSTDMLLVNSETTFINNTTFENDVKITDNLQVDNLHIDGNSIISTNTNGNIDITPNGTGTAVISKVDINGGLIDGTIIGARTPEMGEFTSLNINNGNIDGVNNITLNQIFAKDNNIYSTTTYKAVIIYDDNLYSNANNENKKITLYNYQTPVEFTMVTGSPSSALEFQKNTDVDTTAGNLSSTINNHNAFSSTIDINTNTIIVTQESLSGTPTVNSDDFTQGITVGDFLNHEIYIVTVASKTSSHPYYNQGSSYGYYLGGLESPTLNLKIGTYRFLQSDTSNSGTGTGNVSHPLRFYTSVDKSGGVYTTGVTTSEDDSPSISPGSSGAYTQIEITSETPTLYYQCSSHNYMGGTIIVIPGLIRFSSGWNAIDQICENLGTVTTAIINGGTIDNTIIGSATPVAGTFSSLNVSDGNITNVGDIKLDSITADDNSSFSFGSNWTAAGRTCANLGSVTTVDINGGTIDGVSIGDNTECTILKVDNIKIDGNTISSTNSNGDINITPDGTGTVVISKVDIDQGNIDGTTIGAATSAAGTFTSLNVDNLSIDGNTISSTDSNGDINITPHGTGKINAGTADIDSTGIIGNSNATLLGTISASTPLQPNIISVGTLASLDISGDLSVDTNVLKVDSTNNKVGINKTAPAVALDVVGDVTMSGDLKIGSAGGTDKVAFLSDNKLDFVSTSGNDRVLAKTSAGLQWITYADVSTGGIDTSLVTDILSSPLDTDYYVGNDENNLFVSSGKSNFLENVDIIDSILRIDNSSGNAIELEGSNSTSVNPTIKSTNGGINIESSQSGGTILNICNTDSNGDSSIGFNVVDTLTTNNQFTIGVDDSDANKFKIGTTSIDTSTKLTIDSSGNVGIGVTNPQSKLDIEGSVAIGSTYSGNNPAPQNGLLVEGNVGIGVTNPTNKLEVNGNVDLNSSSNNPNKFIGYGTIPIGGIIMWNGDSPPTGEDDGWALCNGETVNGHTTPDLRGRFIMSSTYGNVNVAGEGNATYQVTEGGNTGGEQFVELSIQEIPSHTHEYQDRHLEVEGEPTEAEKHEGNQRLFVQSQLLIEYDDTGATGGDGSHENRPPFYVLAYIMRVY